MERIVCELSREFISRNWDVKTIFPKSDRDNLLLGWCREQGVEAETSSALLDAADIHTWNKAARLREFIKAYNPHFINIHYGDNFISLKDTVALRASGKRPVFVTVHHPTPWVLENRKKRLMTLFSGLMVDQIITVSHATHRILRQSWLPASKLAIIPCGLRVPERNGSRMQARDGFDLPTGNLIVGSLSRLVPHKGIADLIKAISLIKDDHPHIYLAVAGDGPEKGTLEKLARDLLPGRHKFLGSIKDVDQFMSAIDLFVLPSYMEGFGLVFIEAAFHGIPSVGTNVGGVPDAIEADHTGLLVPPGDYQSLASSIACLARDEMLRKQLGFAAKHRAMSEFTESIMADRYERLFRAHWA